MVGATGFEPVPGLRRKSRKLLGKQQLIELNQTLAKRPHPVETRVRPLSDQPWKRKKGTKGHGGFLTKATGKTPGTSGTVHWEIPANLDV
jgi:hypothetical protein